MPFTVDFAKRHTPLELQDTSLYKRINYVLSNTWIALFLLSAGAAFFLSLPDVLLFSGSLMLLVGIPCNKIIPKRMLAAGK